MIASSFCSVYADRGALKAADSGEGDRLGKIAMESSRVSGFAAATVESVSAAGSEKADSVKLVPGDNYSAFVHYDISGMGYTSLSSEAVKLENGGDGVTFKVLADGKEVYNSGNVTDTSVKTISADITGASDLCLKVEPGANAVGDTSAFLTPVLKKGQEADGTNYRKVSLLGLKGTASTNKFSAIYGDTDETRMLGGEKGGLGSADIDGFGFDTALSLNTTGMDSYMQYEIISLKASRFSVYFGLDTVLSTSKAGKAVFKIAVDKGDGFKEIFASEKMGLGEYYRFTCDTEGVKRIRLISNDGGDGNEGEVAVFADPSLYIDPTSDENGTLYLSEMNFQGTTNDGDVSRDKADGKSVKLGGKIQKKALVVKPTSVQYTSYTRALASQVHFNLSGTTASRFKTTVGLLPEDGVSPKGVVFSVFGDGTELYKSAEITDVNTTEEIDVSVEGYKSLVLRCTPTSEAAGCRSAWGEARLTFEGEISENAGKTSFLESRSLTGVPTCFLDAGQGFDTNPKADDLVTAGHQFNKGIASHPNPTTSAVAKYDLTGLGYTRFSTYVGKRDKWIPYDMNNSFYVEFYIYGDGELLSSTNRLDFHEYFFTSVDITGVKILTIELNMSNDFYNCDSSGWFEPTLYRELDRGEMNITSPQIYPDLTIASYGLDIRGNSRSAGNLSVCLNGNETDTAVSKDGFGHVSFKASGFAGGRNLMEIKSRELSSEKDVYSTELVCPSGEIIKLNELQFLAGSYASSAYYRNENHLGKVLSVASGRVQSNEGICCVPTVGGNMDANFDISAFDYTYFRATVGRDDFGNVENRVKFYVYADGRQVATSREMAPGDVQIITADIPANASTLTLRAMTTEGISANAADWIEPILCKSEASLSKNSRSEFASGSAQNVSAKYNFAARFSAAEKFSEISLATTSSGAKEVALYRYVYSLNRSIQATPVYKNEQLEISGGRLNVVLDKTAEAGEYVLVVYDELDTKASSSKFGYVYADGSYSGAFPDMSVTFEGSSASCFKDISQSPEPEENYDNTGTFTESEKKKAQDKINGYISDLSTLPSSVTIDGKTYNGFSDDDFVKMQVETSEEADYGKKNTTVYLHNKESGLDVTAEFSSYPDYAAYEWTIYFTNPLYGDVDLDGGITVTDALLVLQKSVGKIGLEGEKIFAADADSTGDISVTDALLILQSSVGKIELSRNGNSAQITDAVAAEASFDGANPYIGTSYSDINNANTAPYMNREIYLKSGDEYTFAPSTGRSTENVFPYYNIEHGNEGTFMAIGWSGTWQSDIAFDGSVTTVTAKQQTFDTYLKTGERACTPLAAFVEYDGRNLDRSANLWRKWISECNMRKDQNGDIMQGGRGASVTGGEDTNKTGNQQTQIYQFNYLLDKGVDLNWWWIDAGWYPTSFDDDKTTSSWAAVGNWTVSSRYGDFSEVGENAHEKGKKVLLWFEPERFALNVNDLKDDGSTLKKEWMTDYGAFGFESAAQHMVNLGNDEAREWVTNRVISILKAANFDLYREDFNIMPAEYWVLGDTENRKGITENLSVQGHYKFWDDLIDAGYFIDCCASGGNRNDLQSLRRAVFLHPTDALYSAWNAKQGGAMVMYRWLPYFGANTSGAAGTGAEGKYNLRSSFRPWTEFIYNVPTDNGSVDWNQIASLSKEVKGLQDFIYDEYYELTEWSIGTTDWLSYEFFNSEQNKGYAIVYARERADFTTKSVRFKGLDPDKSYTVTSTDTSLKVTASGKQLMMSGVELTLSKRSSDILYISAA